MPNINLLPSKQGNNNPLRFLMQWTLSYGRYIIVSVEFIVFLVFFSRFFYDMKLSDLNDSIEQKQAIIASASEIEQQIRHTQEKIQRVKTLEQDRLLMLDVLDTLKSITPSFITYNEISVEKGIIILKGEAINNENFAQFLATLRSEDTLGSTSIQEIKKTKGSEIIEFTVSIRKQAENDFTEGLGADASEPLE